MSNTGNATFHLRPLAAGCPPLRSSRIISAGVGLALALSPALASTALAAPPPPPPEEDGAGDGSGDGSDAATDAQLEAIQERLDALEREVDALRGERDEARAALERVEAEVAETQTEAERTAAEQAEALEALETPETAEATPVGSVSDGQDQPNYADGFHFGSYGRVVAAGDLRGRPGRDGDIVARGSRFDESTYAELEMRREDYWEATDSYTRIVTTVAFAHPIFHYDGQFDAKLAVRNLYIEELDLGAKGLSFWAGSRMYRGDDIYVLDWWPLDNLNTVGGGLGYQFKGGTFLKVHGGLQQPNDPFFVQNADRPLPLDQPGSATVDILNRQKFVSSYKLGHVFGVGETGGVKLVAYGETHHVRAGQREVDYREYEDLPDDHGFVAGGEVSLFTGERSTHINLWVRHAWNLAAYGDLQAPRQLAPDGTTQGARELIIALGGNYEKKWFGLMGGAYFRRFRNASPDLDYADLNEGIVLLRPQAWFGQVGGVALEGSYQLQRRGVLTGLDIGEPSGPVTGGLGRVGVMPFWAPGGRGSYARPHIRAMYMLSVRDAGARSLYPQDHVLSLRPVDHFFGFGAEWWFGSTSYFRD